ncbi:MAG: penicillin acylase family protein [Vicinamibacterales bacterium]
MSASLARPLHAILAAAAITAACGGGAPTPEAPRPPQTSGTIAIPGLRDRVSVIRDRWGIPHVSAANLDDLFLAQGFVQAQDRLFQIDLWRRSVQGRLSETLGANFIERDAMTRRFRHRGPIGDEWASYGPDTRRFATAFTRGINAWVAIARTQPPEEFVSAGWLPELWVPEDLLNRTDAFVASVDAQGDLLRARLGAAVGVARAAALLPSADGEPAVAPAGIDLGAITPILPELLRRVGPPAVFSALAAPVTREPRVRRTVTDAARSRIDGDSNAANDRPPAANAWVVGPPRTSSGRPILAVDAQHTFDLPAFRYLVHLEAPGFRAAGATAPWMPGIAVGHNERIAWGMAGWPVDTQDVFVERVNPEDAHQVEYRGRWVDMTVDLERVHVKGRDEPFEYERLYTRHGAVIGLDRDRHLAYTVRWSGMEPGGASELAALGIDRALSWREFSEAADRWRMPAVRFVYADVDGHVGLREAARVPVRLRATGLLPAAGWTGADDWRGFADPSTLGAVLDPADAVLIAPNRDPARLSRIRAVLDASGLLRIEDLMRLQVDVLAARASDLLARLDDRDLREPAVLAARNRMRDWDARVTSDSDAAALYLRWQQAIGRLLAARNAPPELAGELASRIDPLDIVTRAPSGWFEGGSNANASRRQLLADALAMAVAAGGDHRPRQVVFAHPLGIFEDAARRFNVGPVPLAGGPHTVFATAGHVGPTFRAVFDVGDWDRSVVMNAPGQSGTPSSDYYDDMVDRWAAGEYVPLLFSEAAVNAAARETLTLLPTGAP